MCGIAQIPGMRPLSSGYELRAAPLSDRAWSGDIFFYTASRALITETEKRNNLTNPARYTKENRKIHCEIPEGNRASGLLWRQIPNKFVILELCHVDSAVVVHTSFQTGDYTIAIRASCPFLAYNSKESFLIQFDRATVIHILRLIVEKLHGLSYRHVLQYQTHVTSQLSILLAYLTRPFDLALLELHHFFFL